MQYNGSDRDRQSNFTAVRDAVDATASTWFIAIHIRLDSLIVIWFWLKEYYDILIYVVDKFVLARVEGYVNIGSDSDDEIVSSRNV
jgi:hypothetical protein